MTKQSEHAAMPPDIAAKFSKDLTELETAVQNAVTSAYERRGTDTQTGANPWIKRWYDDHVVVSVDEKLLSVPYLVSKAGEVTLDTATATEVEENTTYDPVATMSDEAIREQAEALAVTFNAATKEGKLPCEAWLTGIEAVTGQKFTVDREAKLFEAGDYPDKGIDVTEEDLDNWVANHNGKAPIRIEHEATPFDGALGVLKSIYRKGKELFGRLGFTDPAWELVKTTNSRGLSLGILKDKSGIAEVSLVREPRVADARVFSDSAVVGFSTSLDWGESTTTEAFTKEVLPMPETVTKPNEMDVAAAMKVIQRYNAASPDVQAVTQHSQEMVAFVKASEDELKKTALACKAATFALQSANTDRLIDHFKREGKVVPACEKFARALLSKRPLAGSGVAEEETVTFKAENDGVEQDVTLHFAQMFEAFLEASPAVISFKEIAAAQSESESFSPATLEMFKKTGTDPNSAIAKQVLAEMRR